MKNKNKSERRQTRAIGAAGKPCAGGENRPTIAVITTTTVNKGIETWSVRNYNNAAQAGRDTAGMQQQTHARGHT